VDNIVTVDGPSGVGKGTLSQWLCNKTGFLLLDSGAIYRALAYGSIVEKISETDIDALVTLAINLPVSFYATNVLYDNKDVTASIRNEETAAIASKIASITEVRTALLERQKSFYNKGSGLVADGRDMGTVVFPKAKVKLFLTASAAERAKRRVKQLKSQGVDAILTQITLDIEQRDERDRTRLSSPLVPASDAIIIDTTYLSIEKVYQIAEKALWDNGILK
jgi:cytidylate kinase